MERINMHVKKKCVGMFLLYVFVSTAFCQNSAKQGDGVMRYLTNEVIAYCLMSSTPVPSATIFTINSDGTENKPLIAAAIGLNHLDWSPDGKYLVAVGYMDATFTTWSIHTFAADGTNLKRITSKTGVADSEPAWSPDGTKITFTRVFWNSDGTMGRTELWVTNIDGSGQHYIGIEGFASKWSPDGTRLIYSSQKSGNYEIYTCLIDGTNEQCLTNTSAHESYPVWSSDGKQIAFCASTGVFNTQEALVTYEVYLMNTDGTNIRQLTNNNCYDGYPRWSPDNTRLVFNSDMHDNGQHEIYTMNIDGTNIKRVTNTTRGATALNPVWRPRTLTDGVVKTKNIAEEYRLFQNYPNPFNPSTTIQFELAQSVEVKLDVYDMLGRTVRTLVNEQKNVGRYSIRWDGTDNNGYRAASGAYWFRLTSGKTFLQQKALLLK
jgi:TolB protein